MSEMIILLFFVFLAVLGVSTLCAKLWLFFVRPQNRKKAFTVSSLAGENKEENFLYHFEKYRWYGKEYADYLIFLCDEPPGDKITAFTNAHKNIICCKENQLSAVIKKLTEDEDG